MIYAHLTNGTVGSVGQPPQLVYEDGRWWDLRDRDPVALSARGWLPVTATPRPPNTPTTTFDYSVTLVAGVPTETWTERPKTQAEIDAATASSNADTLRARADAALTANANYLAIASPTTAQAVAQTKTLTKECNALIRLTLSKLDTVTDT